MGQYTREELSKEYTDLLEMVENWASSLPVLAWTVYEWDDTPSIVKDLCSFNGGDEDWVAIVHGSLETVIVPTWVDALGVCDVDTYLLKDHMVFVGSHA